MWVRQLNYILLILFSWSAIAEAQGPHKDPTVKIDYNVMVAMRDGVRLSTDIYRPSAPGKYPAIFVRNPYFNGNNAQGGSYVEMGYEWAKRGYVFIHQDVRGRSDSEGHWYPYFLEAKDGYDSQHWIASQDWSNGKIGTYGGSYGGVTQWMSATLRPPALTAMIPRVTPFNYYHDVAYAGGALALESRIGWASFIGGRTMQTPPYDWQSTIWHLPLKTMDKALGQDLKHWQDWIAHPSYDPYWRALDQDRKIPDIDAPSFNIGGWYDNFLAGTLASYTGMVERGYSQKARQGQKLLIGPWGHRIQSASSKLGELNFGENATVDLEAMYQRWYDHWLKGEDSGFMDEAPVQIFVMGENRWRSEKEWPLARTEYTRYYFHSEGDADNPSGNGRLSLDVPQSDSAVDHFTYDPADPVPSKGGALLFIGTAGPADQSVIEERDDVLSYTTPVLTADTEVTGPVTVTLYAASDALDTDFTAKLVDVHPDGRAYNLADGIIRARYRNSFEKPELLEPGKIYEYQIDLVATSNVFKKGHRIRVDISSSNFPRFDRNPNTGHTFGEDAELRVAKQALYHSREYPSHIVLPIIPR